MNNVPIKMCGVYFLDDTSVLVEGTDYEPSGPGGLASGVLVKLSHDALRPLLGVVVLAVLDQTKVVHGATWNEKEVLAGRYLMSGTKSNRALVAKARYLHVSMKESRVRIMPTEREQSGGGAGWAHLPGYADSCDPIQDQVRDLILEKLRQCS